LFKWEMSVWGQGRGRPLCVGVSSFYLDGLKRQGRAAAEMASRRRRKKACTWRARTGNAAPGRRIRASQKAAERKPAAKEPRVQRLQQRIKNANETQRKPAGSSANTAGGRRRNMKASTPPQKHPIKSRAGRAAPQIRFVSSIPERSWLPG
jgi:hypothetical protein